eukprot:jgi/Botrbrau1/10476/Bobra.0133s0082.1
MALLGHSCCGRCTDSLRSPDLSIHTASPSRLFARSRVTQTFILESNRQRIVGPVLRAASMAAPAETVSISSRLEELKSKKKVAFIPFIMAGDPDLKTTEEALKILDQLGAEVIELGVPYSDPLADGPTIQRGHTRGLERGTTLDQVLSMVRRVTPHIKASILMFTYYNPIMRRGADVFCRQAKEAGVAGLLVPDIPLEETSDVRTVANAAGLELVLLTTPTTQPARMAEIAKATQGFLCLVSVAGPQQVQPWDNNLHIQLLGSGHMGWDSGPHLMHPQQLPPHHMHPQAMLAQPGSIPLILCRRCNVSKPVSDFYKINVNSDGYDGRCKTCDAVQSAERRKRKQRVEAPTVEYKTCRQCGCTKQSGDFYRNKTNPDGLFNNCKACFAADASARMDRMAPLEQRTVPQKICKRCKTPKPAADFFKSKLMSDGLYSHCKECYNLAATERASRRTPAESKECRWCKERKPASDFYNSKLTVDCLHSYCKQCCAVAASQRRSKLQEQQGLSGLPQDVALGMEEQMGLPPGHMGPQMGISQSVPMDGQLMAPPHLLQNGQQIMQPQMTGGPTHMGTGQMGQSQMGQPMQPHMVQQGMGPVSMGGAPMSGQQMAPQQLSMQQLGPAWCPPVWACCNM